MRIETDTTDLRIYVACLASYNAGTFHGAWIDCKGKDADALQAEVSAMLRASPESGAEEFAIRDYEGFGSLLGKYISLEDVAKHAAMIARHSDAWIAYVEERGTDYATEEEFEEDFQGFYDSPQAWAEQFLEDTGALDEVPENLRSYIDYEAYARDAQMNGELSFTYVQSRGEYLVLRNH